MDEKFTIWMLWAVIMVLLAIPVSVMLLWSKAKFRGWEEGLQDNELYHRHTTDILMCRIKAREHALAMYRDISTALCDNISDCMYCPYERDKNDHKCVLWELNERVNSLGIKEVHVDTKHDGGDGN